MRWTENDTVGFVFAAAITTLPLLGIIWLGESLSKGVSDSRIYFLPFMIGLAAAAICSLAACRVAANSESRIRCHVGFAMYAATILVFSFFLWWGEWAMTALGN